MISPSHFKKENPLLMWHSDAEINDFICFLKESGFHYNKKKKHFYSKNNKLSLTKENLAEVFIDNKKLSQIIKEFEKKREIRNNFNKDDARVAGLIVKFLVSLGIINLFLGWIFLHPVIWILLEILIIVFAISFLRLKKKIINILKKKQSNAN